MSVQGVGVESVRTEVDSTAHDTADVETGRTSGDLYIQCPYMSPKTKVLNLRVSDEQRRVYERAAALEGISVSALVTSAADVHADELLTPTPRCQCRRMCSTVCSRRSTVRPRPRPCWPRHWPNRVQNL